METVLIIALTIFAAIALVAWWMLDIDIADIVAMIVTPLAGGAIIYWYRTPIAWAVGALLLVIGGFALYYLVVRHKKPPA